MTEYRRATDAERRRYGVEWRMIGSSWRKQLPASSYGWYDTDGRISYRRLPVPLTGDGPRARDEFRHYRLDPTYIATARYLDWRDERDRQIRFEERNNRKTA